MMSQKPRPCEKQCKGRCGQFKHVSRFRVVKRIRHSTETKIYTSPICKACEQIERNEKKNFDRPKAIIEQRARSAATKAGVSFDFMMINMGYRSLIPMLRAMMTSEGECSCCGHSFLNERDIQIEHREPPRFKKDLAREHACNLGLLCASCNRTKGNKPYSQWLDEQQDMRESNWTKSTRIESEQSKRDQERQFELFDLWPR
jgi:hypothetical protein